MGPLTTGYGPPPVVAGIPTSVRLVAVMHYIAGVGLLVLAALMIFGNAAPEVAVALERQALDAIPGQFDLPGDGLIFAGAAAAVGGLLSVAIGRRIHRGRQWMRILVLTLSAANLVATLYTGIVVGDRTNALFGVVAPVLYLIALNTPAARAWFRSR